MSTIKNGDQMYSKSILVISISFLFVLCIGVFDIYAQESTSIQGTVVDAQTGEALPGVNIVIEGTTSGTTTNVDGEFELNVPSLEEALVFSYIGYERLVVNIAGRTELYIELMTDVQMLDDLVVVGYGVQRRDDISGSITSIGGAQLAEQPSILTSASLMGTVPGVQITQLSGQPGESGGTIRIRGVGTLGDSNPMVLIDGIEGNIDDVPSSDIDNISILKDASAAAIYGSRAANGVILITTKRGGYDQSMQVRYSSRVGVQSATELPEFIGGERFMRLENEAAENIGTQPRWSDEYIAEWVANNPPVGVNSVEFPNTNWVEEVFSETALQQMHNLTIAGGGSDYTYSASLQYDDEQAQIANHGFQRYSLRLNTNVTLSDAASLLADVNIIRADQQETPGGLHETTRSTFRFSPLDPVRYPDGSWAEGRAGNNPLAMVHESGLVTNERYTLRGRIQAIFSPIDNLELRLTYAPNFNDIWNKNMSKQFRARNPETGEITTVRPLQNSLTETTYRNLQNNVNLTANYVQELQEHSFDVLVGTEYIDYFTRNMSAFRDDFTLQDFEVLNAGSAANQQTSGTASEWKLLSFFSRLNYNFNRRYFFTANLRYDGSSRFTEDNRWGLFPSFSVGWRISEESFMETFDLLTNLRLRGSWGVLGNQNIGTYPFAASIALGQDYVIGNDVAGGATQLSLANPNITWEETTSINFGGDMGLWDDRISFTFDWFKRTTDDILLTLPVPNIIGMNPAFQNAGSVKNTGWELEGLFINSIGTDLNYRIGFNISKVENEVVDLRGAGPFISGATIIKEGYPINSIYGYVSDGLFQNEAEVDNHASQPGQTAPGDIRYKDLNGDGQIDGNDRAVIGDPFPNFNYGINLSINYRNIHASALFQAVVNRDVLMGADMVYAFDNAGTIRPWMADNRWTPERGEDATYPRVTRTTSHPNHQASDFWVYDASYLRLRNLQISYSFPNRWIHSFAQDIRVSFLGHNLFTWFDDTPHGIDPNVPTNLSGQYYPVNRLYSVGVDITF